MRRRLVPALVCAGSVGVASISAAPLSGPTLSLQLGKRLIVSDTEWSGGDLSGNVAVDFPVSATIATVMIMGTSRGMHTVYPHESLELTCDYLVAAVRFTSRSQGVIPAYFLVGYGLLQAKTRDEVNYFGYEGSSSVFRYSGTGGTAFVAAGLIVAIPGSRVAIVGEFSALVPQVNVPGGGLSNVPTQFLATAGLRVALGRSTHPRS